MPKSVREKYYNVLKEIHEIPKEDALIYAKAFADRQRMGWRIPTSTYLRCKDLLVYKESLGRRSPYYTDLFKIRNRDHLNIVLLDLYNSIRLRNNY